MAATKKVRSRLSEAQGHRCWYCEITLTDAPGHDNTATIDHLIPHCLGGTLARHNTVAACEACNKARGVMLWFSYRGLVKKRGRRMAQALGHRWNLRRARNPTGLRETARKQHAALLERMCANPKLL